MIVESELKYAFFLEETIIIFVLIIKSIPDGGEVDVVGPAGPRRGGEESC